MACTVHVAWDEGLTDYHFGPEHPLAPVQVELTMRLADEFGLWDQPGVHEASALVTEGVPAEFEPFESGYNPSGPVGRAIMATRNAVSPLHGLMPL